MSFLKPRMNRLPRWEGPVLERKSNPGFPRCPQPELEGTCYVEGGSAAPPECENTPANQRPSAGHLAATRGLWGKVLQTTAPRDKQKGLPASWGGARVQAVTYVQSEPLHPSLMQARDELEQRMHDRRLRDTNTDAWWAHRLPSTGRKDGFLSAFAFTHYARSGQKRTRKMWPKTVLCEHFREPWTTGQGME